MEDLVIQIQQGRTDLLETLWLNAKGLIAWFAGRYYGTISASGVAPGGVTVDDLIQCGYFALLGAAEHYDPEKGSFASLLKWYTLKEFQEAIGRSNRKRNDPLNRCRSLDEPVGDDESDDTLLDLIADNRDDYTIVDEKIFTEQLRAALEEALDQLPQKEAYTIRGEFFENKKLKQIGNELGCCYQYAQTLRQQGLHHLRTGSAKAKLERFLDDNTSFYKGVSAQRFSQTQTSQVERLVIRRESLRQRYGRMFNDNSEQENTGTDN